MVKFDRNGYKNRDRLFLLANNAIYLVAERKEIKDIILLDTLKGEFRKIKSDIGKIKCEVSKIKGDIGKIKGDIRKNKGEISKI